MGIRWDEIQDFPEIKTGDLHVWLAKINAGIESIVAGNLMEAESLRARTFTQAKRKAEYIVSRGLLRGLIGKYLGIKPPDVMIVYSKDGKPAIGTFGHSLRFNLSHSGNNVLIAFSRQCEVGVDIERVDIQALDEGTVARSLHPDELVKFQGLDDAERSQFFFDHWTRKEAFLKLLGCGFAMEPGDIAVSGLSNGTLTHKVYFSDLPPIDGYCCSVATSVAPISQRFYTPSSNLFA